MFITNSSYQDLQGLCLGIFCQPFQVVYECQSISSAFLYRCLKISRERGGKSVQLVCPGTDFACVWHSAGTQELLSALWQMDNCMWVNLRHWYGGLMLGKITHSVFQWGAPVGSVAMMALACWALPGASLNVRIPGYSASLSSIPD